MQNWKRMITQSLPFTARNISGDVFNQMILGNGPLSFLPGGATMVGLNHRLAQKYPQVMDEGLLLSRAEPSSVEIINKLQNTAVHRFLTEGLYKSNHPDPLVRWLATVLQPANWLYPVFKVGDMVNLITGGRYLAPRAEGASREGGAVAVKMAGGSDAAAKDAYWRTTCRFNERPGLADASELTKTPGFFNPMLQAVRGALKNLTDPDPAVSGGAWVKLGIVGGVFITLAGVKYLTMSEEEKKRERERRIEDRMNYYPGPWGLQLRFPLGIEGAVASFSYNAAMDYLLDRKGADGPKQARLLLNRVVSTAGPMEFFGPQIKTAMEASSNWSSFFQTHIVSPWMVNLPASEQRYASTPEFYNKLGEWFNYSPAKIQYIVRNGLARQADEVIRMLDNLDTGRPIVQERADIPFVGGLFIRDPIGFGSASVQEVQDVEAKLQLMELRLKNRGWSGIENWPEELLTEDMRAMRLQVEQARELRRAAGNLSTLRNQISDLGRLEMWEEQRNLQKVMVLAAQGVLANNKEVIQNLQEIVKDVSALPRPTREQKAIDMLAR
jgi:hypothetical protein